MERTHTNLYYGLIYAMIFFVLTASYVVTVRMAQDLIIADTAMWIVFAGLVVLLIGPAYYIGLKFVRSERRGITRREGISLALTMASMSLVVSFAALSVSEIISTQNGRAFITLFTSFQTVPAFVLFWVLYSLAVAVPMGVLLWIANRREVNRTRISIDDTFS